MSREAKLDALLFSILRRHNHQSFNWHFSWTIAAVEKTTVINLFKRLQARANDQLAAVSYIVKLHAFHMTLMPDHVQTSLKLSAAVALKIIVQYLFYEL